MAQLSRGALEEGTVIFNHQTEINVTFDAASFQNIGFSTPPVVKLISVGTLVTGRGQTNLIFNTDGTTASTYTYSQEGSVSDLSSGAITNTAVAAGYTYLNDLPTPPKVKLLNPDARITIPFSNAEFSSGSLVQIFLQIKFTNFDSSATDNVRLRFINKSTIDSNSDTTPASASQTQILNSEVFINDAGTWKSIDVTNGSSVNLTMTEILAGKSSVASDGLFHWFRIDLTSGSETIADLAGLNIANEATDAGETIRISDATVVEYPDGTVGGESPFIDSNISNANIGVTFKDVTVDGMTVITSAPFTGTVRYLCSVNG